MHKPDSRHGPPGMLSWMMNTWQVSIARADPGPDSWPHACRRRTLGWQQTKGQQAPSLMRTSCRNPQVRLHFPRSGSAPV